MRGTVNADPQLPPFSFALKLLNKKTPKSERNFRFSELIRRREIQNSDSTVIDCKSQRINHALLVFNHVYLSAAGYAVMIGNNLLAVLLRVPARAA